MMLIEDLGISKWYAILQCKWLNFSNSRITEIVLDEYSHLEPLGFENMINFEVLMM